MKYQVMPDLTPIEYEALKADIADHGILVPVEVDETGELLDGHHRVRAWQELRSEGIALADYSRLIRVGWSEEQKRNHARRLNVLRRQLSKEQREQTMRDMRKDGMTLQEVADAAGVSHMTVQRAIENSELTNVKSEITNKRGQRRPATYAARKPKSSQQSIFDPGGAVALDPKAAEETVKAARQEKTEERRADRKAKNDELCLETPSLEEIPHKFDLVYADPPWRYEFSKTDSRVIENQYPTMSLDDICAMPVTEITIVNAVLFLWATMPKLEEALRVVNAWGFSYRTAIAWDKVRMGQGIYTRQQVELLLICIKGEMYSPELDFSKDFRSIVTIERSNKHSEKPEEFYDIIEGLYPDCTKIELFARDKGREGWMAWGNQTTNGKVA